MSDKPDLSDLKARLGLTKSSVATTAPVPAPKPKGGPPGQAPMARAPGQAPGRPPGQAPIASQPQAPQPQAAPAPAPRPQTAPLQAAPKRQPSAGISRAESPKPIMSDRDLNVTDSTSMDKGISIKMIAGALVVTLIGLAFGYAVATVQNDRQLVEMRKNDANAVREKLTPKFAAFKKAHAMIKGMSEKKADGKLATALNEIDFKAGAGIFGSNKLLLGPVTAKLVQYTVDSTALKSALKDHDRTTNKIDAEEISKLLKNNEIIKQRLGVIYDYKTAAKKSEKEGATNKPGQLVQLIKKSENDKNKLVVKAIGGASEVEVDSRQFIGIPGKDVLRMNGKNALSRYEFRVKMLKYKADLINKYLTSLDQALAEIVDSGETPIVSFSKGESK